MSAMGELDLHDLGRVFDELTFVKLFIKICYKLLESFVLIFPVLI